MSKRIVSLLLALCLLCVASGCRKEENKGTTQREFTPQAPYVEADLPELQISTSVLERGEPITVSCVNFDEGDQLFVDREGFIPGGSEEPMQTKSADKAVSFPSNLMTPGMYRVFLCDDDGVYVHDMAEFYVYDTDDMEDYCPEGAELIVTEAGFMKLSVEPASIAESAVEYRIYWSLDGVRLEDYTEVAICSHNGSDTFTVELPQGLTMPQGANGLEIVAMKGLSTGCFVSVPVSMQATEAAPIYRFNVLSDMHVSTGWPKCVGFAKKAFQDIIAQGYSSLILTTGDNTERGQEDEYDLLEKVVSDAGDHLPNIYYAMGNHDIVYNNNAGFEKQVALYSQRTGMPGAYYAMEKDGFTYIVLGSDTLSHLGTIGQAQQTWLREELDKADPQKPVFVVLHQPIKDTVSGTLTAEGENDYGLLDDGAALRAILQDYPNAIVFTGHTHLNFLGKRSVLQGQGAEATYVACSTVGKSGGVAVSEGLYVEVYEDYVLLRGRDFGKGKWVGAMQIKIPLKK